MCAMISGLFIRSNDGRTPQAYKENRVSLTVLGVGGPEKATLNDCVKCFIRGVSHWLSMRTVVHRRPQSNTGSMEELLLKEETCVRQHMYIGEAKIVVRHKFETAKAAVTPGLGSLKTTLGLVFRDNHRQS